MNLWVSLFVCNNFCQCKLTGVSEESLLSDLLEDGFQGCIFGVVGQVKLQLGVVFRVTFLELLDKKRAPTWGMCKRYAHGRIFFLGFKVFCLFFLPLKPFLFCISWLYESRTKSFAHMDCEILQLDDVFSMMFLLVLCVVFTVLGKQSCCHQCILMNFLAN